MRCGSNITFFAVFLFVYADWISFVPPISMVGFKKVSPPLSGGLLFEIEFFLLFTGLCLYVYFCMLIQYTFRLKPITVYFSWKGQHIRYYAPSVLLDVHHWFLLFQHLLWLCSVYVLNESFFGGG